MSYHLEDRVRASLLEQPERVDPDIARIEVEIRPDSYGEHSLFFLVLLKDSFKILPRSPRIGARLQRISDVLHRRVVDAGLPLYAFVNFARESEVAPKRRRQAG
ncbi:MAG: hypothetical protein IT373_18675 [Polyangiaceae bacterium]|nr:hypothetical protein [Polyangiaceae bacterium]